MAKKTKKEVDKNAVQKLRREYTKDSLSDEGLPAEPMELFENWFKAALSNEQGEINAAALSTCDRSGQPSVRMVLVKGFDQSGFVFFTNYNSRKGQELLVNPNCALLFYWPNLERQIRIEGRCSRVEPLESDQYFSKRPRLAQISASISPQSQPIESRQVLEEAAQQFEMVNGEGEISRPAAWGGFRVSASNIEFWQGRENRLHDRISYSRGHDGSWQIARLAP